MKELRRQIHKKVLQFKHVQASRSNVQRLVGDASHVTSELLMVIIQYTGVSSILDKTNYGTNPQWQDLVPVLHTYQ